MEQDFLGGLDGRELKPAEVSLFDLVGKQKRLMSVKELKISDGKEGVLVSLTKEIFCLPGPIQLRKGLKEKQKVEVGAALRASVQISGDRRLVRVKFVEKIAKLEGIDKVSMIIDEQGKEAIVEIPAIQECVYSTPRNIPDGGSLLLALQNRPAGEKQAGAWLVVRVEARIYLEAEERRIRAAEQK